MTSFDQRAFYIIRDVRNHRSFSNTFGGGGEGLQSETAKSYTLEL